MPHLTELYDVALLDLDGVVYVGPRPVSHAPEALRQARTAGMRLAFVTNNAARPPERVAAHLTEIGVEALPDEVVTSAQAAARLLAEQLPAGSKVLVVGGEGLEVALREQDLVPVSGADDGPVAVVQGFSPTVGWPLLAEGTYAVASGLPWVATNTDPVVPTDRGRAPGNGTLVAAIRTATGREPVVAGKPEPPMHREAILRSGATRPLVVGDRLDTDIEGANAAGADSLLVLTGVTDPIDVVLAPARLRPTYVGHDLRALHVSPDALRVRAGDATVGAWHAVVDGGGLRLTRASAHAGSGGAEGLAGSAASDGAGSDGGVARVRGAASDGAGSDGGEAPVRGAVSDESRVGAGSDGGEPGQDALDGLRAVCGAVWAAADATGDAAGATGNAARAVGDSVEAVTGGVVDRASVEAALDAARITRAPARPY
nr:HAD-IIA family hydrolase [Jiangella ureilytica]